MPLEFGGDSVHKIVSVMGLSSREKAEFAS